MAALSIPEIISLSEADNSALLLPSSDKTPIVPFKEQTKHFEKGALFQKECSICKAPSKYQCPKCSALSCSVACVKTHKDKTKCDGLRDKTAFVAVDEFKDANLQSDYHFLEDTWRHIDIAHRGRKGTGLSGGLLPHNLYRLQVQARLRKTDLQILPLLFAKRQRSTTWLRYGDKTIFWRLEWEFPHGNFNCYDERVDENTILRDCVNKYIKQDSPDTHEQLSYYYSLEPRDVIVLLRDENCPSNVTQYHILDQNRTLKSNLKHKKIIEYPSLAVISKVHLPSYQITT